jgi:multidrug resistance protein, MATE family
MPVLRAARLQTGAAGARHAGPMPSILDHATGPSPWRAELRATVALALPIAATQLAQVAIVTTNVLMIGHLGPEALAAGALGANVFYLLSIFCIGVLLSTSPMVAQAIGRGRHVVRDARRSVRQALWVSLLLGLPACFVIWNTGPILELLGQEASIAAAAQTYARAAVWGFMPMLWFTVLRSFVSALQRPNFPLLAILVGVVANAGVGWVVIFGHLGMPEWGLAGAGAGAATANFLTFLVLLAIVMRERRISRFAVLGRIWRADWARFCDVLRIGLPIGTTMVLETAMFSAAIMMMGWIGTASLAAHQVAVQCAITAFMVPVGIAHAVTVRVGIAAGAGDGPGVRRAGYIGLLLGAAFMCLTATLFWGVPEHLIGLFIDAKASANREVVRLAISFLAVAALFQVVDALQAVGQGALRGLKETRRPMLMATFGYWVVGVPSGALLAFKAGLGGVGIWLGLALGLAVVAVLVVGRFHRRARMYLIDEAASKQWQR